MKATTKTQPPVNSLQRISKGIKDGLISDADFLAVAMEKRMKKRPPPSKPSREDDENQHVNKRTTHTQRSQSPLSVQKGSSSKNSVSMKSPLKFNANACDQGNDAILSYPILSSSNRQLLSLPSPRQILAPLEQKKTRLEDLVPPLPKPDIEKLTSLSAWKGELEEEEDDHQSQSLTQESSSTQLSQEAEESMMPSVAEVEEAEEEGQDKNDGLTELRHLAKAHLLHILNEGSYDQLQKLRGIGKARATALLTYRNSGNLIQEIEEGLEWIGMTPGAIRRFLVANLGSLLA
eukprot:scaffold440_cov277-Ochromonas_danica.AAC.34